MKTIRIMITTGPHKKPLWISLPKKMLSLIHLSIPLGLGILFYFSYDYIKLTRLKITYQSLIRENMNLKSEAQVLVKNIEDVNKKLDQIRERTQQVNEFLALKVHLIEKKIGLSHQKEIPSTSPSEQTTNPYMPTGVNFDKLSFGKELHSLNALEKRSQLQAIELKQLLSNLVQQSTLFSSVPSMAPLQGWIASRYGSRASPFGGHQSFHRGVDISAKVGAPIFAPADGVVIFSGEKEPFGNFIMIAHSEHGIVTRYGHNHENLVKIGQQIFRGEQIATVGTSGKVTGPHLHYEIQINGQHVDPMQFMLDPPSGSLNSF